MALNNIRSAGRDSAPGLDARAAREGHIVRLKSVLLLLLLACSTSLAGERQSHTTAERVAIVNFIFELTKLDFRDFVSDDAHAVEVWNSAVTPSDYAELSDHLAEPMLSSLSDEDISRILGFIESPAGILVSRVSGESATAEEAIGKARLLPEEERTEVQLFMGGPAFQKLAKSVNTPATRQTVHEWAEGVICRYYVGPAQPSLSANERAAVRELCPQ